MRPTHLAVFDFDNTLFRSPEKPPHWPAGKGWWGRLESLTEPCVPETPGAEWWNTEVVMVARDMIDDPNTLAVLMTGRLSGRFDDRVHGLLAQAELSFDEVHLAKGGTLAFKLRVLERIIAQRPELESVDLWDDREEHMPEFVALFERLQIPYRVFLVEGARADALC